MPADLKRLTRSEMETENQKGKDGAPLKRGTRDSANTSVQDAYRDLRLEERFFLGNTIGGLRGQRFEQARDMRAYRPSSAEKQRGRDPRAFAQIENDFGRVEMGLDRQREFLTLAVSQRIDADRSTLPRHRSRLNGDNATPVRGTVGERGATLASTFEPDQSAIVVKSRAARGYRDALSMLDELKARGGSEVIEEVLPFLSNREERQEETRLQSVIQNLAPGERQAAQLRLNHVHRMRVLKSQRRLEFIQRMNASLQEARTRPQTGERQRASGLLDRILARLFQGSADGGAPLDIASLVRQFASGGGGSPQQMVKRLLDRFGESILAEQAEWESMLNESDAPQKDAGSLIQDMIAAELLRQIAERFAKRKEAEGERDKPENEPEPEE